MKLCTACHRHVRPAEAACPFCGEALRTAVALPLEAALLISALGVACSDRPLDTSSVTEASSTATATTATTATSSGASTSSGTSTGEQSSASDPTTGDSGCAFYGGCPTDFVDTSLCDPWAQDCPRGEKCVPASLDDDSWESLVCVQVDPNAVGPGQGCASMGFGVDTCDKGSVCWFLDPNTQMGTCTAQCVGSPEAPSCSDPSTACVHIAVTGDLCLPLCDPLAQDCPLSQVCVQNPTTPDFICAPDTSDTEGKAFDACESLHDCDPGLACAPTELATECDPQGDGCCLPYCDTSQPASCPGAGQECVLLESLPMGFESVGRCQLP